ncbi:hypothetical protein N752_26345 [Desulforamulus aquiferis]|nr:hypothetical protein N752_26345 [Desulforamulus aquiferis]
MDLEYRTEQDVIGTRKLPINAYYGIHTSGPQKILMYPANWCILN